MRQLPVTYVLLHTTIPLTFHVLIMLRFPLCFTRKVAVVEAHEAEAVVVVGFILLCLGSEVKQIDFTTPMGRPWGYRSVMVMFLDQ
jgi:hypothetical protein